MLDGGYSRDVAFGDLDGDGDLDAFVANYFGGDSRVWLNDGHGTFSSSIDVPGADDIWNVQLGDLDGNGTLDAFLSDYTNDDQEVWLNDGSGHFSDSGQTLGSLQSTSNALADLDGDHDLDAVVAGREVWLNDGHGTFVQASSFGAGYVYGVALGHLNGDADPGADRGAAA